MPPARRWVRLPDPFDVARGRGVERIDIDKKVFQGVYAAEQEFAHEFHVGPQPREQVDQHNPVQRSGGVVGGHDAAVGFRDAFQAPVVSFVGHVQVPEQPFGVRAVIGECLIVQIVDFMQTGHPHPGFRQQACGRAPAPETEIGFSNEFSGGFQIVGILKFTSGGILAGPLRTFHCHEQI